MTLLDYDHSYTYRYEAFPYENPEHNLLEHN